MRVFAYSTYPFDIPMWCRASDGADDAARLHYVWSARGRDGVLTRRGIMSWCVAIGSVLVKKSAKLSRPAR